MRRDIVQAGERKEHSSSEEECDAGGNTDMSKEKRRIPAAVLAIIEETAKTVAATMYAERNQRPDDCYKQTIKRIKALPVLQDRVADNRARLENGGVQQKSKSIVRFSASGVRADPEEMYEAIVKTLEAHVAADQQEIDTVTAAMEYVKEDYYFAAVYDGLILHHTDAEIAEKLHCEDSTVRRNRSRLLRIIAVRLYGVEAL